MKLSNPKGLMKANAMHIATLILLGMFITTTCWGSQAMQDDRTKKKSSKEAMTRSLFLHNKKLTIELPKVEGAQLDPVTGAVMATEDVKITNADNQSKFYEHEDLPTDSVYSLSEITVEARSRFTPEHEGRINLDFIVNVPQEMVSADWRIVLTPHLIDGDSTLKLKPLLIKGREFANQQRADIAAYGAYIGSIIDTTAYDSAFLDHGGIKKAMVNRQQFYYSKYYYEWNKIIEYDNWKTAYERDTERKLARKIGEGKRLYHQYILKSQEESMRLLAYGKDSTGVYAKVMREYAKKAKPTDLVWTGEIPENKVPKEFKEIHRSGRTIEDVYNDMLTEQDSINIAKHHYFFDQIAENELKKERKDEYKDKMIPFPFEKDTHDSLIVDGTRPIQYTYKYSYPTRIGMKRVDLVMEGQIEAIDRSRFDLGTTDTLSYYVASMGQLVDQSLVSDAVTFYRDVFNRMTAYLEFAPNSSDFDVNYKKNKEKIKKIIDTYKAFTDNNVLVVDSLELTVSTSLDGVFDRNAERTMKRSASIKNFFETDYGTLMQGTVIKPYYIGEDWQTLASIIKTRKDISNKDGVLKLLSEAVSPDYTELMVKRKFPREYRIMYDSIYPMLNKTDIVFNMHRPEMTVEKEVRVIERPNYDKGVALLLERDYWAAIEILSDYPDYNTALTLTCLGYNAKAFDVLQKIEPTGYTEYLLTILSIRMGNDDATAVEHLKKAIELDPGKLYRIPLDPEVNNLVRKYNLSFSVE